MFLNLFKKREEIFLALDIGTNSVKAVFFKKIPESKKPAVSRFQRDTAGREKIAVLASSINYFEKPDVLIGKDFRLELTKKTISFAIEQLRKSIFFSKIDKSVKKRIQKGKIPVLLCFSPAKIKARIFEQNFVRKNFKNKISAKEEKDIAQEILKKAKENISEDFADEFGILKDSISWLSLRIISQKIDGYIVPHLEGYEGKEIKFKILAVFSLKSYLNSIKNIIKSLGMNFLKVVHISEILPRIYGVRPGSDPGLTPTVFIDIGASFTQFFLVKNKTLEEINEINMAGNLFTESLVSHLGLDENSAELLKEKYSKGLLSPEAEKKVKELFKEEKKKWYLELRQKIQEASEKELLFSNIYIFGGGSQLPEIKEIIEKEREKYSEEQARPFLNQLTIIYPKDLEWIKNLPQDLTNSQLAPLLICSSLI